MIQPEILLETGILLKNRYRVKRQLGKGGFSQTFEVDDGGKSKVVKVLLTNDTKAVLLFKREADVLKGLRHSAIPKVDSDGYFTFLPENSTDPLYCLVMEFIEGQTLQDWLSENECITQSQACDWLKQLTKILEKIHLKDYFHRDIKPANVMIRPNGQLVLIDFGAVREVTETYLRKLDGQEITQVYSHGYTPPEQTDGQAVLQSDFFALGRTMVYLLTGKHPLRLPRNPQTSELIWREEAKEVSESLARLIDDMMAILPGQRPQNAEIILRRLESLESASTKIVSSKPVRRGLRWKIAFGLAASIVLGVAGIRFALVRIAIVYNDRGVAHYLANRPNQAILDFNLALKLEPNYAEAYYNRGTIYEDLQDFERARSEYRIAAKGGITEAYNNLARLYILDKEYTAAVNLILQVMKQTKPDKDMKYVLHKNLGWARLGQQRYAEAKEHLQMAIKLTGDRAAGHCLLAQVLEAQKDDKAAIQEWESCRAYASEYNSDEDIWKGMADKRKVAAGVNE